MLPKNYEVPDSGGQYMKFEQGDNRFRPLGEAIVGFVYWTEDDEGRHPIRVKMNELESIPAEYRSDANHFWAIPVYNYASESIQILEITQRGIQGKIAELEADSDWGDPVGDEGYDILVNRTGTGKGTKYSVSPKPHKPLKDGVMAYFRSLSVNLNALFDGNDPFSPTAEGEPKMKSVKEIADDVFADFEAGGEYSLEDVAKKVNEADKEK